jgi:hypothetical protein
LSKVRPAQNSRRSSHKRRMTVPLGSKLRSA